MSVGRGFYYELSVAEDDDEINLERKDVIELIRGCGVQRWMSELLSERKGVV